MRLSNTGDLPEAEDDFDDWIDQVYGFLHMILPLNNRSGQQPTAVIHILTGTIAQNDEDEFIRTNIPTPQTYNMVPHTEQALKADNRICLVQKWHKTLQRLPNMTDAEYEAFLRYCTEFFVAECIWHKDRTGGH
jgi:hypothetical protein